MKKDEARYKRAYRRTVIGKAKTCLGQVTRRAKKAGLECNLTQEWFELRLMQGRCEQTSLPFQNRLEESSGHSLWAFSVDRIDPNKGYIIENCQAVVWAYNAAKGAGSHEDVKLLAEMVLGIRSSSEFVVEELPLNGKFKTRKGRL